MSEKILDINDLMVEYKTDLETVKAVNGISFVLNKGETYGIVGETGAGKTTTALSILRLLPERTGKIMSGSIEFDGKQLLEKSIHEMQSIRGEKIAMIFQDPMTSLNPVITIGGQIEEAIMLHNYEGRSKAQITERANEVLKLVGLQPERRRDYPHQFSGGMKQRVVIAIALACEPNLLIADEPTTALDVTIQAQVISMIRDLRDRLGMSMIMITHDLGIVAQTCDKVAVMYAGEFVENGTLEDIFVGDRHHPYTEGLFNAIPNIALISDKLTPIPGLMPDPTNLPEGCYFFPRCPHRMDICKKVHPADVVCGTHSIKCHLYSEVAHEQ